MSEQPPIAFELSFVTEEPVPIPPVSAILERVRARPNWDAGFITPVDAQFPRVHIEWYHELGFVIQCYEDETSWSDFLVTAPAFGSPAIEVELGGQVLERWPRELFVSDDRARQALEHFIATGKQDPELHWVRIDVFPRETLWEGRAGREAWERAKDGQNI